jgi:hypothetical protein
VRPPFRMPGGGSPACCAITGAEPAIARKIRAKQTPIAHRIAALCGFHRLAPFILHAWVRLTTGLTVLFLTSLLVCNGYSQWTKTTAETNECRQATGFPYMAIYIDSQRLREPIFDGRSVGRSERRTCARKPRNLTAAHVADIRAKIADLQAMERVLTEAMCECEAGRDTRYPLIEVISGSAD